MVQLYNYQVWHTAMNASQACSSTSYYISGKPAFTFKRRGFFI